MDIAISTDGKTIPITKVYTKAKMAKKIRKSYTWVCKMAKAGDLIPLKVNGAELVCHPKDLK